MFVSAILVQNGSLHQKDTVHDNDFEPYLSGQSNQVSLSFLACISTLVLTALCDVPVLLYCRLYYFKRQRSRLWRVEVIGRLLMRASWG